MKTRFMTGVCVFGLMLVWCGCVKKMEGTLPEAAAAALGIPVEKTLPKSGIVLRLIPAGTFMMGSPESERDATVESVPAEARETVRGFVKMETQHKVTITKPFYIGKCEVTQGQWKKVMEGNPSRFTDSGDNAPVEAVSWHDCTNFMSNLAVLEGMPEGSFRLPTEAQWEYACRAGTATAFCYGDVLDESMANFNGNYPFGKWETGKFRGKTVAAGQFKPNAWGLYNMHGNVWEWCADWYGIYGGEATDPSGTASGSDRVVRGGSWLDYARYCRSAFQYSLSPAYSSLHLGFRLSLLAGQQ